MDRKRDRDVAQGEAPQLPAGYGTTFVVALVPPLWRRMLDPRVSAWRERHLKAAEA